MTQTNLSQEYARAVYALALENWQETLTAVQKKLADAPELLAQLMNTQTSFAERQKQLDNILPANLSDQARKFLYTLLQNGHMNVLGDVATNLTRLATKGPGLEVATVTTAIPLTDNEKAQFQSKLSASYGEMLEIDFVVDKSILGGAVVQVGDKIIDGSVASKLDAVRDKLATAV